MATYRSIATTETDPQAPITAALMKALEANPTAIAEGATGAPRVLGKALGSTFIGGGSGAGTTPITFTSLDGMETIKLEALASQVVAGQSWQIDFSNDNGAAWAGYQTLVGANNHTSAANTILSARINLRTGAVDANSLSVLAAAAPQRSTTAVTVPANCNAFRLRLNTGSSQFVGQAWCFGGLEA